MIQILEYTISLCSVNHTMYLVLYIVLYVVLFTSTVDNRRLLNDNS